MSELTKAMIVNGVILVAVLMSDLGPVRAIARWRLLQPLVAAAVIVPLFLARPVTSGTGLIVEIAGVVAGAGYAIFWIVVIGARSAFSYGSVHWFAGALTAWAIANQVPQAAITDGLIVMAVVMLLVRTAGLWLRASRLADTALAGEQA